MLFDFDADDAVKTWQTVNDGVMGGRSVGQFKITEDNTMQFFGTLSLENNGGFASVRTRATNLNLTEGEELILRVRGDGRRYSMNLYVPRRRVAFSYRASFETKKDEWTEIRLPLDDFVATSFGRVVKNQKLDPTEVNGLGILLGDKKAGPFKLGVEWVKVGNARGDTFKVQCEGTYQRHLQGICNDEEAIYWSFTTTLVKTDMKGKFLKKVSVANHHGDLCFHEGKLYVAVNLGKFNAPKGNADSWVYVYDAATLQELTRHETQEVFHGAGGIGYRDEQFFVVGGLPDGVAENYVYEYDSDFKFVKKHVIKSGHTHLGIQTATFAHDRWWFGCYGDPTVLLVTDPKFQMKGRYALDCSLGIVGMSGNRLLVGSGRCEKDKGCTGGGKIAFPDEQAGYKFDQKEKETQ
ncbi:CIA30 family protein [Thalassoglobus neptunius]|nr:CIA30 family protein [Thalassoglobus neptunius]